MSELTSRKAEGYLLIASVIWGFAFVAQRVGMEHLGPFAFNGIRFTLGGLALIPVLLLRGEVVRPQPSELKSGLIAGGLVFGGASLQQIGLLYTTVTNAGFITGLYVVLVPLLGIFIGKKTGLSGWVGALLAIVGMFLLNYSGDAVLAWGDFLELLGAIVWAAHVLYLAHALPGKNALRFASLQFLTCGVLSLLVMLLIEKPTGQGVIGAFIPLLYGSFLSVGIGYTLQVVGQTKAHPSTAAIIMSLEAVFSAIGGTLILGERLSLFGYLGCTVMFLSILAAQGLCTLRSLRICAKQFGFNSLP